MMFSEMPAKRSYTLGKRAEAQRATRERITAVTVALHEEVGPARTQVSEIARRAGVQRLTVYRHFPEESDLIAACSAHWSEANPVPDPEPWAAIADPAARAAAVFGGVYGFYARNARMLANVHRDAAAIPALREELDAGFAPYLAELAELLLHGRRLRGQRRERAGAQAALLLGFDGWQALGPVAGRDPREAAALAAALLGAVAACA